MTRNDIRTMVDYNYWARDRLLEALEPLTMEQFTRDLGNSFKSIRDTAAHIHAAEWIWLERWKGGSPAALLPHDRFPDLASLRAGWRTLEADLRAYVDSLDEPAVNRVHDYKLLSGAPGSSPFWQMLQHVVNHGSYHRGQVTTMLRQMGLPAGKATDMIAYYREGSR